MFYFLVKQSNIFFRIVLSVLFLFAFSNAGASVKKGFKALSIYDYFLAKKNFYKAGKKHPDPYASYGLAVIFSRNDNPFFNLDSASKYAALSYCSYLIKREKAEFSGFKIDSSSILNLVDTVAFKQWAKIRRSVNITAFNNFLTTNYLANSLLKEQAVYLRDELEFNDVILKNNSDTTQKFINSHPQSSFLQESLLLIQRQVYEETTLGGSKEKLISFIERNPKNLMMNTAYENLYKIYRKTSDVNGLKTFVENYKNAPQFNEAWKLLFSLTVTSFTNEELEKFLQEHPAFPFKTSILKELELNKITLFPYEQNDLTGYINANGKKIIQPEYETVTDFYEGLAVVSRNDSVFYINKENTNPFNKFYSEAYTFKNGLAAVKEGTKWSFINRQGQVVKGDFEEISELSNSVYVVKQNAKYGAVDQSGQTIIEPRFQKLGDFKNEFAYYMENGKYGFVSKTGYVQKAEYDWISDFSDNIAIIKQNNLYGLTDSKGQVILPAGYDLVLKANNSVFIIIKNDQYGFFSGKGCFITAIAYDYLKEKPTEFYTNGHVFKLLKKGEQGIIDGNGKPLIDFGTYDEVNFASNGLIKVKRKNKYGYVDRKLSLVIPYKFEEAGDFTDSLAIVNYKQKNSLINTQGKEVFTSGEEIKKLSKHYFVVGEGEGIVNSRGEKVFSGVSDIQKPQKKVFIITLDNKEIKLLRD